MLLQFTLQNGVLTLNNPEVLTDASHFNYIQCQVRLTSEIFNHSDTLVGVFKSASFNREEEVLFDTLDGGAYAYGFVPGRIFEHGGIIQMFVYRYLNGSINNHYAHECTNIVEFYIDPRRYVPLRTSEIVQQLANEFQVIRNQITDMTVGWHEDTELSVEKSLVDGGIHLDFGLVRGPQGIQGERGPKGDPFTYSDFTPSQLAALVGPQGPAGPQGSAGPTGPTGPQGPQGAAFTYADFTTEQLAALTGPQGPEGPQGPSGVDGSDGENGVGIVSIVKTGTSGLVDTYTITYTDDSTSTFTVTNGANGSGGGGGDVSDVKVDGTSVVTNGVANINTFTAPTSSALGTKGLVPAAPVNGMKWLLAASGWRSLNIKGSSSGGSAAIGTSSVDVSAVNVLLADATQATSGLMSYTDKVKLNSITLTNGVIDGSCLPTYNGGVS